MTRSREIVLSIILLMFVLLASWGLAKAQSSENLRPVDLMIVIDNSCSMFPREQILPGCTTWGSDPDFLRIRGADLFISRLGFGQENEADYHVGVVDLGDTPVLVGPLQASMEVRDSLAYKISRLRAKSATRIVPALEMAYKELRESPERLETNQKAVVLITDGVPWPQEGQSNQDIEKLIQQNGDIPLFLMLLQGADERTAAYEQYIQFWQQMQLQYNHVFVYLIQSADQIEETYNIIVSQLQDTVPTEGGTLPPGTPGQFFVSEFVDRIIITAVHQSDRSTGSIEIIDPLGHLVNTDDPGVAYFRGRYNPVEVISIKNPRLDDSLKERYWFIKSDEIVDVFIDREGAYKINFLSPETSLTDVNNIYMTSKRQNSSGDMVIRFNLKRGDGTVITSPQEIRGDLIYPDGTRDFLKLQSDLMPDSNGIYEMVIDFAEMYPNLYNSSGRLTLLIKAGVADVLGANQIPVATTQLLADIGPGPVIQAIHPSKLDCIPGQPANLSVMIRNIETVRSDSIQLKVASDQSDVSLENSNQGVFRADLSPLCAPLIERVSCSGQVEGNFNLSFEGELVGDAPSVSLNRVIPVQIFAPACTPTPFPVAVLPPATPIPQPTAVGDSDGDGLLDPEDACPYEGGWNFLGGCPIPKWFLAVGGGLAVTTLASVLIFSFPWLRTKTFGKPPQGFLVACRRGKKLMDPINLFELGTELRKNKISIGGEPKKVDIHIQGLKSTEFIVKVQGDQVVITDAKTGNVREAFRSLSIQEISTSNDDITIAVCLNEPVIHKWTCP